MKTGKIRGKISAMAIVVCSLLVVTFSITLDAVADEATMYELTVTVVSGHGTVEPNSGSYSAGTVVTLTGMAEQDYLLRHWTGTDDDTSCGLINTVTMNSDKTVTVEFGLPHLFMVPLEYDTIQEAIDASACGDKVILSPGVHYGNINFNGKNITITSQNPDDPNVMALTIIQGTGAGSVVTFSGNESESCMLDGLTITGGDTTGDGGGICGNGTEATIANCVIANNHADGVGGGVSNCSGRIVGCTMTGNTAGSDGLDGGGGIYVFDCNVTIEDCDINNNAAADNGGGLCFIASPGSTITRCTISDNDANGSGADGGGIYVFGVPPTLIEDCRIICNSASRVGGGVCLGGEAGPVSGVVQVRQCLITENTAGEEGGGISCKYHVEPRISNCTIADNQVTGAAGVGYGGGLNCSNRSNVGVTNSIIWGNYAEQGFQVAVRLEMPGPSTLALSHSDVEGGPGGAYVGLDCTLDWGIGAIDSDPQLVDPNGGDWHLGAGSPCIDAGDNSAVPPSLLDLDGNPRIRGISVDMGAYEAESYGPIAHWKFDEGTGGVAYDSAGNNDGTIYGAAWTTGIIDGALDFDGVDDYVDVGNDSNLMTTGDLTIIAWIKALESRACIYSHTWNGWRLGFGIGNDNNDGRLGFYTWNHRQWIKAGSSLADDIWHHVAVTLSGTMVTLYTDGIEIGSDTGAPASDLTGIGLIGLYNYDWHFGGLLDDVRIYDRALSAGEVMELYAPVDSGPVAHWKFDEGAGGVAYDSAGTNDGTIYGAAWASGVIDGALDFDGVDDYVDVGNDKSLMTTGDLTIIAWIKALESRACIYSHTWNGWRLGFGIGNDNNDGRLGFYTWNHRQWIKAGSSLADDIWHHVAVTLSGTMVTLYTDGIEIGSDTGAPASDLTGIGLIGLYNYDWHFGGLLDDIRIYDRALSAGEVEELYNSVPVPPVGKTYHVDGVNGSDLNDGLTKETAFATIQKGIDSSDDGGTVLVWPGVYNEAATQGINFKGKAITVKSAADAAVLEVPGFTAVTFAQGEDGNSIFSNFVVRGSSTGILTLFANPTINNVTIVDNDNGVIADNANPEITNCIFWNNFNGDLFGSPDPIETRYSWFEDDVNEPNMPAAGLISHWKFDEGGGLIAYDSAGNNYGVVFGATWTTSPFGNALDFDGVDDYVDMADTVKNYLGTDYTLSAWITTDTLFSNNAILAYRESTSGNAVLFQLDHYNEDIRFTVRDNLHNSAQAVYASILTTNTWYHIACVREGNILNIYVNGVSGAPGFGTIGAINPDNLKIGALQFAGNPPSNHFDGTIDEVSIYDRALSAEEVEQIYEPVPNPLFANAAGGDYHLKSERGRYWPAHDVWVLDDETSPCIDGGDPGIGPTNEPMPNGGRINMGAYGNTAYASMSECRGKADINCDGIVNFKDLAFLAQFWLEE